MREQIKTGGVCLSGKSCQREKEHVNQMNDSVGLMLLLGEVAVRPIVFHSESADPVKTKGMHLPSIIFFSSPAERIIPAGNSFL